MKAVWFKLVGWFYLPISVPGFVITLAALAVITFQIYETNRFSQLSKVLIPLCHKSK
jgi:hypothetical protein